ncbi:MAG TPA: sulfatase [Chloroflexota bacterium]|nr:sulfatase [Chloroflexota bacterium]
MRILYVDIDSLRPDHLGCYGYHRQTSPNIDRLAAEGVRFTNCFVPDAPCLPSRTALFTGRFGIHNGVINHGGVAADPFIEGPARRFRSRLGMTSWMACLRVAGFRTVTVSPFGERHSAWHWYANFNEVYNTGKGGLERADEIAPVALDWIARNGKSDNWFLHVNFWDPHTPYRTPDEFGDPFEEEPLPDWLTEEVRQQHWNGCGPHSAQEIQGFAPVPPRYRRQPSQADSMAAVRMMFDGYDTGVLYADTHVGRLLNALADQGVLDDTVIMVSADHGENLGELNVYGDHHFADFCTSRVPLIVRWPGVTDRQSGRVDDAFHYQQDWAATLVELAGGQVPENWDGRSFAAAFRSGEAAGRDHLVISQGAWSCQRSVVFDHYLCIRSYHDGYHAFPDVMLFDVAEDPHEQHDLADERPRVVEYALNLLERWHGEMMRTATHPVDPMWTVISEGGPLHTRGQLPAYLERLRTTGRAKWAERLTSA